MGVDRPGGRAGEGRGSALRAHVVPDVPSFAVDGGFRYRIPEALSVEVGSIVRIPLSGRRVRGYVIGIEEGDTEGLKDVAGVTGDLPIFDERLLRTLQWAAQHYVGPLSATLGRPAPPNAPRRPARGLTIESVADAPVESARGPTTILLAGRRNRIGAIVARLAATVAAGRSAMVIAPTEVEVEELSGHLAAAFGKRVLTVTPSVSAARVTTIWGRAATQPGLIVVGTERLSFWPLTDLGLAVVVEEGRRAMKAKQTPTFHVREVIRKRATVEGFDAVFVSSVPTSELVAAGARRVRPSADRLWPLVEIVDRTEEPPGSGIVTDRVRIALRAAVANQQKAFVFTHLRGYAPAFRCVACRSLRTCPTCGAASDQSGLCRRCATDLGPCAGCGRRRFEPLGAGAGRIADELSRAVGAGDVSEDGSTPVRVGTERDLPELAPVDVAVIVDADALIYGTNYRAREDALRLMARVAAAVGPGHGRRLMVQTSRPESDVLQALRRADPMPLLESEVEQRAGLGFPPAGSLIVLEVRHPPAWADERLREDLAGLGTVLGPAPIRDGLRWLVQGPDLAEARRRLRSTVQELRDGGGTVRVDVDPVDL